MSGEERRRAQRHPVDEPGELFLSESRRVPCRIRNLGELGALVQVSDLEEPVLEGERAVLEHPVVVDGDLHAARARTVGVVVRVELEFQPSGILRQMAVFFDGGARPDGCAG